MELRIMTEPQQGATYDELLEVARATERAGLAGFFASDHYLSMGSPHPRHALGPHDVWTTLAGLARETERIRLGSRLSAATFRLPGPLAIAVAEVDEMSGGRVELGLGAGWYEAEHLAYGIAFPASLTERRQRLVEQLEIIQGLWATPPGATFDYDGRFYQLADCPALAKPVQRPRPPMIIGGKGQIEMPRLAARFADECNVSFSSVEHVAATGAALDAACAALGRDPASLVRSVALTTLIGSDEQECERRAAAIGRELKGVRESGLAGTAAEILDELVRYRAIGVTRVYLQFLDLTDIDQIDQLGDELVPLAAEL